MIIRAERDKALGSSSMGRRMGCGQWRLNIQGINSRDKILVPPLLGVDHALSLSVIATVPGLRGSLEVRDQSHLPWLRTHARENIVSSS